MNQDNDVEFWLSGNVQNIPSLLQPVAHALLQARKEVNRIMLHFNTKKLWEKPAGIACVGFHLQHLTGVLDRLFTYARNESLTSIQLDYLSNEEKPDNLITTELLISNFNNQVDVALKQLSETSEQTLTACRPVGRKKLPSTVIGLLFHAAEHCMRHVGQLLVTVKILSV